MPMRCGQGGGIGEGRGTEKRSRSNPTRGRALRRLQAALAQPKSEWARDAAIQRFEFTFELTWKNLAHAVRGEGLDCASPRLAFRAAVGLGWIGDDMLWLDMLEDRNRTTHTYEEATAEEIHARLSSYASAIAELRRAPAQTSRAAHAVRMNPR